MTLYRHAQLEDLPAIQQFVDYWLSGRGVHNKEPGAVNDCFIAGHQHLGYIKISTVLLAYENNALVGWAVKHRNGSLIHLLVAGPYRGRGIGSAMLLLLNPPVVRCKTDQSTGDPTPFYLSHGYKINHMETSKSSNKVPAHRRRPLNNICILTKKTG